MKSFKFFLYYFLSFIRTPFMYIAYFLLAITTILGVGFVFCIFLIHKQYAFIWYGCLAIVNLTLTFFIYVLIDYYDVWVHRLYPRKIWWDAMIDAINNRANNDKIE